MKTKDLFYQEVRGVAIIAVVLIHSLLFTREADTNMVLIFRQLINFPVAIFFFISGYFIKLSDILDIGSNKKFIIKKLIRVMIPYLVWSSLGIIFIDRFYGFDIKIIVNRLLTGQAVFPYYFIIAMIQFILITPVIIKAMKNKTISKLLWFITPFSLILFYILELVLRMDIFNSPYYQIPFVVWFSFYYYGIVVRNKHETQLKICNNIKINTILYVIFLIISIIEAQILNNKLNLLGFAQSQLKISSALCTFFLINILIQNRNHFKLSKINNILVKIGDYSFGIFLIHIFVLRGVSKIAGYIIKSKVYPLYITILFAIITIIISCLVIKVTLKITPQKYAKKILGF